MSTSESELPEVVMFLKSMLSELLLAELWLPIIKNTKMRPARDKSKRLSSNMTEIFLFQTLEELNQNMLVEEALEPRNKNLTDDLIIIIIFILNQSFFYCVEYIPNLKDF